MPGLAPDSVRHSVRSACTEYAQRLSAVQVPVRQICSGQAPQATDWPQLLVTLPQRPPAQVTSRVSGVQHVFWKQIPPAHCVSLQHPLQIPLQQWDLLASRQSVSPQQALQLPLQRLGLVAGQVHRPFWHSALPQQPPPSAPPHASPTAAHVGQQLVPLAHPLLSIRPSGIVVRQRMTPEIPALPRLASRRFASTRQAPLRFAPAKVAPVVSALRRLAFLKLAPRTFAPRNAFVPPKSHLARLAPGAGVHEVPG